MGKQARKQARSRNRAGHWTLRPLKEWTPRPPSRMTREEMIEGLTGAIERLERGWLQGKYAVDAAGHESLGWLPDSEVAWDALGACRAAVGPGRWGEVAMAVATTLEVASLHAWNDEPERTQAEVIAAFARTVERLSKEAA